MTKKSAYGTQIRYVIHCMLRADSAGCRTALCMLTNESNSDTCAHGAVYHTGVKCGEIQT